MNIVHGTETQNMYTARGTTTESSAEAELDRLAKERMRSTGEAYAVAYTNVLQAHPKLYKRYVDEAEARKARG